MDLKNLIKNFRERRRRKRFAEDLASGKIPRGRTAVVQSPETDLKMISKVKMKGSISARVIRKDGTVEDLGIISRVGGE